MTPGKSLIVLALIAFLACAEVTVVVTGTPSPALEARPTDAPVFVATAAPLPASTPVPTATPTPAPTPTGAPAPPPPTAAPRAPDCDPSYPDACIPPPPDLDCGDIPYRRFRVQPPDPHRFNGDHDGIGCERD